MRFQIIFRPVTVYGFGFEVGYLPRRYFQVELLLWNRQLIVGWARD